MNNTAFIAVLFAVILMAVANGYQAITGKRLSKAPSRRSDEEVKRQSAIAAVVLGVVAVLGILLLLMKG